MEKRHRSAMGKWWIVGVLVTLGWLFAGCQCDGKKEKITFEVRPEDNVVSIGPSTSSLTALSGSGFEPLPSGYYVTTDASGQALIVGKDDGNTCSIHLFHQGTLIKSSCDQKTYGTTWCVEQVSAAYVNCNNQLVQTPSGEFQVKGSWVLVTYVPKFQLTLLVVLEGEATFWPVVQMPGRRLGDPLAVNPGQFAYTVPDDMLDRVPDLQKLAQPRQARPLGQLAPLIERLDLQPWVEQARVRAKEDGIPLEVWPAMAELALEYGGGELEKYEVARAMLQGAPWAEMTSKIFGQDLPVWTTLGGERYDARAAQYSPEKAREYLVASGHPEGEGLPDIALLFPAPDEQLAEMAKWVAESLGAIGMRVFPVATAPDVMRDKLAALIASGQPAMWLGWR